jgi:hypothetical protein
MILSKIKTYALAALSALVVVGYAIIQILRARIANDKQQDAEAQRDLLVKVNQNRAKARKEGKEQKDAATKNAESGDWSAFNDDGM